MEGFLKPHSPTQHVKFIQQFLFGMTQYKNHDNIAAQKVNWLKENIHATPFHPVSCMESSSILKGKVYCREMGEKGLMSQLVSQDIIFKITVNFRNRKTCENIQPNKKTALVSDPCHRIA
jgi:hypothetical protein